MQWQVVLAQYGEHVHAFLSGRAEDFDDFAFGVRMTDFPLAQLYDYLVADTRRTADIARFGHIDVVRHTRVIGEDEEELAAALQGPDDLGATAFENANDGTGTGHGGIGAQALRPNIAPN